MVHLPQHLAPTVFHIGIDLAWADKAKNEANESGILMLSPSGHVEAVGTRTGARRANNTRR